MYIYIIGVRILYKKEGKLDKVKVKLQFSLLVIYYIQLVKLED